MYRNIIDLKNKSLGKLIQMLVSMLLFLCFKL